MNEGRWIDEALERHERPLTQYAAHLLRDADRARDVVQETFCRLCKQDRASLDGHLTEWLYTVCRNHAMDVLRKERRMKSLSDTTLAMEETPGPPPEAPAEQRDDLSAIQRAMHRLPPNQQEVVRLKFQQDLTYRQIAAVTGHSIGNVGFMLHTAINKLRETLT